MMQQAQHQKSVLLDAAAMQSVPDKVLPEMLKLLDHLEERIQKLESQVNTVLTIDKPLVTQQRPFSLLREIWRFLTWIDAFPPYILGAAIKIFIVFNVCVISFRISSAYFDYFHSLAQVVKFCTLAILQFFSSLFGKFGTFYAYHYCRGAESFCADLVGLFTEVRRIGDTNLLTADHIVQTVISVGSMGSNIFGKHFRW